MLDFFLGLVFLGFWCVGAQGMIHSFQQWRTSIQSKKWIKTEAIVTGYRIESYSGGGQVSRTYYGFFVLSTYQVQGIAYESCEFRREGCASEKDAQFAATRSITPGNSVTVFYNPNNPQQSTTSPGWDGSAFMWIFISFGILSLSTGLLLSLILRLSGMPPEVALKTVLPLLQVMPFMVVLAFCSFGSFLIVTTIKDLISSIHRQAFHLDWRRFATGSLIFAISFGFLCSMLLDLIGGLVIGAKPDSGCYRPDFTQKRWVAVPCPPPRESNL